MCYYITMTLPSNARIKELRPVIEKYDKAFIPLKNPKIQSQLPTGELYFIASKGHCDCGTAIGAIDLVKMRETLLRSQKYRSILRRKWSKREVEKWLVEKMKKMIKELENHSSFPEYKKEVESWMEFIRELLASGNTARVGLIKHWYHDSLETEKIILKRKIRLNVNLVKSDVLLHVGEDILYEFYKQ
ncbi:MAG: hypothetical protein ACTSRW_04820 [Candidatus Helarchaeota archaeon]